MYKVTSGPTTEPVSLADAKLWLKIHPDVDEDDELVRALIATSRRWAEHGTSRALITQTIQEVWDCGQIVFHLSIAPLIAVTKFEYRDTSGTYVEWANTNYTVDDVSQPGRVVVNRATSPPYVAGTSTLYPNLIRITYTAGSTTPAEVPDNIKTAMLLQIKLMYDNREDMPLGKETSLFARTAWNLLSMSRTDFI